jgi:V-type H+-transporting ATPase subunit a
MAKNKIAWLNTYKMKMSIVFGVTQMMYGNVMSLLNHM